MELEHLILVVIILIFLTFILRFIIYCEPFTNEKIDKIDLVYTWVSNKSEEYNNLRKSYTNEPFDKKEHFSLDETISSLYSISNYFYSTTNDSCNRLSNLNEIVYSIKSVKNNLKWVNNIYVVLPKLHFEYFPIKNLDEQNITLVAQEDLLGKFNPSFNSNAIELCLDEIPNLSDKFIYMNDDVIINKPIFIEDMIKNDKILIIYQDFGGLYISPYLSSTILGLLLNNKETSTLARYESSLLIENNGLLISHAPIIIDKKVYKELKTKYKKQVLTTLNNRFRDKTDLVFPHYIYPHHMIKLERFFTSKKTKIYEIKLVDNYVINKSILDKLDNDYSFLLLNDERNDCNDKENIKTIKNYLETI